MLIDRRGTGAVPDTQIDVDVMLPAAAQGVVGVECLDSRGELRAILSSLEDPASKYTTAAERAVAATLNANCQSPVASFATIENDTLTIDALVASSDGATVLRERVHGKIDDAEQLGHRVADQLLKKGAGELLVEEEP